MYAFPMSVRSHVPLLVSALTLAACATILGLDEPLPTGGTGTNVDANVRDDARKEPGDAGPPDAAAARDSSSEGDAVAVDSSLPDFCSQQGSGWTACHDFGQAVSILAVDRIPVDRVTWTDQEGSTRLGALKVSADFGAPAAARFASSFVETEFSFKVASGQGADGEMLATIEQSPCYLYLVRKDPTHLELRTQNISQNFNPTVAQTLPSQEGVWQRIRMKYQPPNVNYTWKAQTNTVNGVSCAPSPSSYVRLGPEGVLGGGAVFPQSTRIAHFDDVLLR
jgi:hypothetical protein